MTGPVAVAVLGLGAMGLPMALRLAETHPVVGFDAFEGQRERARGEGLEVRDTAVDAVQGADVVLLAVRNGAQLEEALLGEAGVAAALADGAIVLLTSTVGVDAVRGTAAALAERGVPLVDAP
ncbi:MAG: NAD(P)-binding domain-containing protein, partial [Amnibacterium sp.]